MLPGDCINSSPAGKRRIAAEKQLSQLADEASLYSGDSALLDGSSIVGATSKNQNKSPMAFVTVVAVAICSISLIAFVAVFAVLQVSEIVLSSCLRHVIFHVH